MALPDVEVMRCETVHGRSWTLSIHWSAGPQSKIEHRAKAKLHCAQNSWACNGGQLMVMTVIESQVNLNLLFILANIPRLHNACVVVRSGLYVTGMKDVPNSLRIGHLHLRSCRRRLHGLPQWL